MDGEFLSLDPEAVTGHSFGAITAIAVGPSDESLWIGTEDEGILRIGRNGKRIHYSVRSNHLLSDRISQLTFVSPSLLYILYADGRLGRYSSTQGYSQGNKPDSPITQILPGYETGTLIFATADGKIYRIDESSPVLLGDIREPVATMTLAREGLVYVIGADSRRVVSVSGSGAVASVTPPLPDVPTCLLALEGGDLWAGTGQGLYCWAQGAWTRYSAVDGLISNRIKALLFDGKDAILIATSNGVERLNVSNPNVSGPNAYFAGESFSCGTKQLGENTVFYFGGPRGLAAILTDSAPLALPWSQEPEVLHKSDSRGFSFWHLLFILTVGLAGFILGRFLVSRRVSVKPASVPIVTPSAERLPVTPAEQVSPAKKPDTPPLDSSAAVPPSREDILEAINKLKNANAPEFSLKVWNMIEDCYPDQDFSVQNIASRLLLSRVHVNRKLQQEIGVSPSAILKARRMIAARELMLQGGKTLPQIAQLTGFSSAAFLSTSFKEYYGQSPSELIKSA